MKQYIIYETANSTKRERFLYEEQTKGSWQTIYCYLIHDNHWNKSIDTALYTTDYLSYVYPETKFTKIVFKNYNTLLKYFIKHFNSHIL